MLGIKNPTKQESIRGKIPHVYRVIILKQMADHENRCCSALVHFILNGNQGRCTCSKVWDSIKNIPWNMIVSSSSINIYSN